LNAMSPVRNYDIHCRHAGAHDLLPGGQIIDCGM
jgi:hypothetical protein